MSQYFVVCACKLAAALNTAASIVTTCMKRRIAIHLSGLSKRVKKSISPEECDGVVVAICPAADHDSQHGAQQQHNGARFGHRASAESAARARKTEIIPPGGVTCRIAAVARGVRPPRHV